MERTAAGFLLKKKKVSERPRRFPGFDAWRGVNGEGSGVARTNTETSSSHTMGPPYAMALDGCIAGTTTRRWRTSAPPGLRRCSTAHATARSECSESSTGARNTRSAVSASSGVGAPSARAREGAATPTRGALSSDAAAGIEGSAGGSAAPRGVGRETSWLLGTPPRGDPDSSEESTRGRTRQQLPLLRSNQQRHSRRRLRLPATPASPRSSPHAPCLTPSRRSRS